MGIVVTVVLLAVLAACVDLAVPPRPRWAQALVGDRDASAATDPWDDPDDDRPAPSGLFTREGVQRRLDLLAAELRQLETDRTIFARAFRTYVVRDAYQALLADRSRLARVPTLQLGAVTFEEDVAVGRRLREEIDI